MFARMASVACVMSGCWWLWYSDGSQALNRFQLCLRFDENCNNRKCPYNGFKVAFESANNFCWNISSFDRWKCFRSMKINSRYVHGARFIARATALNKCNKWFYLLRRNCTPVNQILTSFQWIRSNYSS